MTEPIVAQPAATRTKLVISILYLAVVFLFGSRLLHPHQSSRVFAATAAVTSIVAGVVPALGSSRPRLARWLLVASLTACAFMFGFLTRLLFSASRG